MARKDTRFSVIAYYGDDKTYLDGVKISLEFSDRLKLNEMKNIKVDPLKSFKSYLEGTQFVLEFGEIWYPRSSWNTIPSLTKTPEQTLHGLYAVYWETGEVRPIVGEGLPPHRNPWSGYGISSCFPLGGDDRYFHDSFGINVDPQQLLAGGTWGLVDFFKSFSNVDLSRHVSEGMVILPDISTDSSGKPNRLGMVFYFPIGNSPLLPDKPSIKHIKQLHKALER